MILISREMALGVRHHAHVPDNHAPNMEIKLLVIEESEMINVLRKPMLSKIFSYLPIFNQVIGEPDDLFE